MKKFSIPTDSIQARFLFYIKTNHNGCGFAAYLCGNGSVNVFVLDSAEINSEIEQKKLFDNLGMEHEPIIDSIFPISKKQVQEIAVKVVEGADLIELFLDYEEEYKEEIEEDGIDDWDEAETLSQNG